MGGFSYIWLLLSIAVIAVGLIKGAEVAATAMQREQERALLSIGNEFRQAIRSYYEVALVDGSHQYPASFDDLLSDSRFGGVKRHLRKVYADPVTGRTEWGLVRIRGGIAGVHSLTEKRALKQQGFDGINQQFTGRANIREWVFAYPPEIMSAPEARLR